MGTLTATQAVPNSRTHTRPVWLISRGDDLIWFIGSTLVGYAALGLMAAGFPVWPFQLIWMFGIDGPHVLATVTRTYFDREERRRLGPALWYLPPFMLLGPVMTLQGHFDLFLLGAVVWQHFHIVKQHYGFVMLYKAKNKERDRFDLRFDRWVLLLSLWIPLLAFIAKTRGFERHWQSVAPVVLISGASGAACWIARQVRKYQRGENINVPKVLLIGAVVPLQGLAFAHAAEHGPDGILRAGIVLGMVHGLQYHRLLWFHNRNRYAGDDAGERYGLAAKASKSLAFYLAIALGLNLLLTILPVALLPWRDGVLAATWGIAFTHYVFDAKIWRPSADKGLAAALRL